MNKSIFTLYEHESLRIGDTCNGFVFEEFHLVALQKYYGTKGVPYFSLIHKGVKFCEYVGIIQIGNLTIEVLPKIDKNTNDVNWRDFLIDILKAVGVFSVRATSNANLKIKSNTILELYFELLIAECEYLMRNGLLKQYRKIEKNSLALKGSLNFAKNIQQNLVHQERFYVNQTVYDTVHIFHKILFKAIILISEINTNQNLSSRIGNLLLNFPEMPDLKTNEAIFDKLVYNRKTEVYNESINIAKMILLNYHPDLIGGRNNILALMFDMNLLWERFVYESLRKDSEIKVQYQKKAKFWVSGNYSKSLNPDLFVKFNQENFLLDTKWKNVDYDYPSDEDLRQIFAYLNIFDGKKGALIYPTTNKSEVIQGKYTKNDLTCNRILIGINADVKKWQLEIREIIKELFIEENE